MVNVGSLSEVSGNLCILNRGLLTLEFVIIMKHTDGSHLYYNIF